MWAQVFVTRDITVLFPVCIEQTHRSPGKRHKVNLGGGITCWYPVFVLVFVFRSHSYAELVIFDLGLNCNLAQLFFLSLKMRRSGTKPFRFQSADA